ncbi:hypothetical protein DYB31_009438 [Aphanomyces astaci]|uniref:Sm domain-containing protein n=1 Tax=Aphanomyces astaci TaxID=112090 RepID=A0A397F816_APHAT|nr:hypothetical protein DYB31_009438 [Aphanomyces astaci]
MGCLASKSRRVNVPPPSVHVVSPQVSVHDIPHDALPVTPRPPSTTTNTPNTTIHSTDSREATASSKAHQLSKAFSSSGLPGGGGSGRRNSRHHTKGVLASVRSHLSLLNTSNRSVNSNRSSRNSFGVSTSGGSMKGYKFDAMLEPDPGSNHTLVDSAFRAKGYRWIISQVESKTHAALDVHKSYMGDDLQHEVKLFHGGDVVDAVRNRNVMTVLDIYAKCLWDTLTMSATTSMWRVQVRDIYNRKTSPYMGGVMGDGFLLMVVDGISPGHPLVLNVLLKFVRESVDRHVIVLRNIAEDAKFPLPRQSIAFSQEEMSKSLGVPLSLLHEGEGHAITLELKNGEIYRGHLVESEDSMNCQLKQVTLTGRDGQISRLEQVYVRGSQVKLFILPDMLQKSPLFKKVQALKKPDQDKKHRKGKSSGGRGRGRGRGGPPKQPAA